MNENPSNAKGSTPEPESLTSEKESIRKTQEEFVGDEATPSIDKSEYEARQGKGAAAGDQQSK